MATSVLIPTHGRAASLDVALRSLRADARGVELVVVVHGPDPASAGVARRWGATVVQLPPGGGINVARNAAVEAATGDLLAFLDDDVEVHRGWHAALEAAHGDAPPHIGAFAGRIVARIESPRWRQCGREGGPVTELPAPGRYGWGANLAIRRSWVERIGSFDPVLGGAGDEQEWQDRLRAAGGEVAWVGDAVVDHRRAGEDASLPALCRAAFHRGRAARRFEAWEGRAPAARAELRTLAGSVLHGPRFRCAMGPVMAAHTWGRIREARDPQPHDAFLSGRSGTVGGRRDALRALADRALDVVTPRVRPGAPRRVVVIGVERRGSRWPDAVAELRTSQHDLTVLGGPPGDRGKFQNLNALLEQTAWRDADWVLVLDDDVELPRGFLDSFLAAAEREGLLLAQPAHRRRSHAAWPVTRRRPLRAARRTTFVEIGPVTAFARPVAAELLPFPDLRMGWGLDAHWAAVARERGWPIGVVDATPVRHLAPVGGGYDAREAVAEARAFLTGRDWVGRDEVRSR